MRPRVPTALGQNEICNLYIESPDMWAPLQARRPRILQASSTVTFNIKFSFISTKLNNVNYLSEQDQ